MSNFQRNINQLIGLGAIASQLPAGQSFKEGRKLKEMEQNVYKRYEQFQKRGPTNEFAEGTAGAAIAQQANEDWAAVAKRQFERDPSNEQAYLKYREALSAATGLPITKTEISPEEAMEEMRNKGKRQIEQRVNYGKLKTSLGGTVDDLPPAVRDLVIATLKNEETK